MKKNNNKQDENAKVNNLSGNSPESVAEEIPFAVDEDLIKDIVEEPIIEEEIPFAVEEMIEEPVDEVAEEIPFAVDEDIISEETEDVPEEIPFAVDEDLIADEIESADDEGEEMGKKKKRKHQRKRPKMSRKKKIWLTIAIVLGSLLVIGAVLAAIFWFFILPDTINKMTLDETHSAYERIKKVEASSPEEIKKLDKINILVLGLDEGGQRSDSILIVNFDIKTQAIKLLSIPRDTRIYVEDRRVMRKINEVYGMHDKNDNVYGASAVMQAIENLTGMEINYYVEFSFDAIDKIMDQLGPVKFDVPDLEGKGRGMNYDDPYQNLHIHLKPGMQELSGNQIQQFLRYRKSNYRDAQNVNGSDLQRVERQQALLGAIIDQKLNLTMLGKAPSILGVVTDSMGMTFSDEEVKAYIAYLVEDSRFKNVSSENMISNVLPNEPAMINGLSYVIFDKEKTAELMQDVFGYEIDESKLSDSINLTGEKASGKIESIPSSSKGSNKTSSDKKKESVDEERTETRGTQKNPKSDEEEFEEMKKEDEEKKKTSSKPKDEEKKDEFDEKDSDAEKDKDEEKSAEKEPSDEKDGTDNKKTDSTDKDSQSKPSTSDSSKKDSDKESAEKPSSDDGKTSSDAKPSDGKSTTDEKTTEKPSGGNDKTESSTDTKPSGGNSKTEVTPAEKSTEKTTDKKTSTTVEKAA